MHLWSDSHHSVTYQPKSLFAWLTVCSPLRKDCFDPIVIHTYLKSVPLLIPLFRLTCHLLPLGTHTYFPGLCLSSLQLLTPSPRSENKRKYCKIHLLYQRFPGLLNYIHSLIIFIYLLSTETQIELPVLLYQSKTLYLPSSYFFSFFCLRSFSLSVSHPVKL